MIPLASNLVLAVVWAAARGDLSLRNLGTGFALGYLLLVALSPFVGSRAYVGKVPKTVGLALYFAWELVVANLRVAHDVLTATHHMTPGIIAVPLDAESDLEITLLANLLTLTPGTLSLDVSSDRRTLYVHEMYLRVGDLDEARHRIKSGFERRLLDALR